jgi:hypothetical protein
LNLTLTSQLVGFLIFFATGAVAGAAYDILRIWRAMFRSERRTVFFQDFFYMVLLAYFTFLVNLAVNYGELRLYLFAGETLGWFVWHWTVGRVTVGLFRRLFDFLYRKFFDPASAWLRRTSGKLLRKAKKCAKSGQKRLQSWKNSLKHHCSVVYNQRKAKRKSKKRKARKRGVRHDEADQRSKTSEKHFAARRNRRLRNLRHHAPRAAAGGDQREKARARFRGTTNQNSRNQKR